LTTAISRSKGFLISSAMRKMSSSPSRPGQVLEERHHLLGGDVRQRLHEAGLGLRGRDLGLGQGRHEQPAHTALQPKHAVLEIFVNLSLRHLQVPPRPSQPGGLVVA
jgi:hypothetical protein